ncbi:MAG TPA: hypothetical protein VMD59_19395 [Acidimicrobiales bacterium]|nr:hypothetical protein [Acidimicrobiales bacterium]
MPEQETTQGAAAGGDPVAGVTHTLDLVKRYVVQETVGELPRLGKRVGLSALGGLLIGTGFVILLLAVLRTLQTETGTTFAGNLSFLPYVITFFVALGAMGVGGLAGIRMFRRSPSKQGRGGRKR